MARIKLAPKRYWTPGESVANVVIVVGAWMRRKTSSRKDDAKYRVKFSCGCEGDITHGQLRRRMDTKSPTGLCRVCGRKTRVKPKEEKKNWQPQEPLGLALWPAPKSVITEGHWHQRDRRPTKPYNYDF